MLGYFIKNLSKEVIIKNSKVKNKSSKLKQRFSKFAYIFVGLFLIIWSSSSFIASYFIGDFLKSDYGLELSKNSVVRYNPFTSHLTIRDFTISKHGKMVFQLEKGDIEIRLHRLIMKQVYISEFKLDGLFLAVEQQADSNQIAGIELVSKSEPEIPSSATKQEPTNFELTMPEFEFLAGKVAVKVKDKAHLFLIKQFTIINTSLSLKKQSFSSRLELALDNAPIEIDLDLAAENNTGTLTSNLSLKEYQLGQLAKYLPKNIHSLYGFLSFKSNNKIDFSDNRIVINNSNTTIAINEFEFEDDRTNIKQGEQVLSISDLILNINNKLDADSPRFKLEVQQVDLTGGKITAEMNKLKFSNQGQQTKANNIAFELKHDSSVSGKIASVTVDMLASQGQKDNLLFESRGLNIILDEFNLRQPSNGSLAISVRSNLYLDEVVSYIKNRSHLLARVAETKVENIFLRNERETAFSFEKLQLKNVVFSEHVAGKQIPELVSFNYFSLNGVNFDQEGIEISSASVDGLNGYLFMDKNKEIANLVPIGLLGDKESSIEAEPSESIEKDLSSLPGKEMESRIAGHPLIKLDRLELTNVKTFTFSDESVSPEYKREIFIDEMLIQKIDASQPLQQSPFSIKGRSDRYSKFEFAGFIKPFTEKTNLTVKGHIMEVSLPSASGYIEPVLGFQFESGELDTLLNIEIIDSAISGNSNIHIRGLELATAENYEQDTLKEQTAMPLNVALGMLKDGDGNVELDIPMLGDLDSPTFGYSSFIALITQKAVQAAAQSYLIKTFIPYAELLSITFSAGEFILKTRFEDLIYNPTQITISESQLPYMQQFVALMKDKKNTQVKVCATATIEDLAEEGVNAQTEEQKILKLKSLAQQRMIAFEEYAVTEGIESSRILTCTPKVDLSMENRPKITISI